MAIRSKNIASRKAVLREHPEVRTPGVWKELPCPDHLRAGNHACSEIRRFFLNRDVSVQVYDVSTKWGPVNHLLIRPHNALPIRSWYTFQEIKDHCVGPNRVAVEVFPRRADLHDEDFAIYHLWVLPEGFDLPFGLHLPGSGMWTPGSVEMELEGAK